MKKITLISAAMSLLAFSAFGQTTISVTGQNITASPGSTVGDALTLSISGTNSITNIESVNMLLRTLDGSTFFTVSSVTPTSPFTLTNSNPSNVAFNTAGDANNTGWTVSNPSTDLGSNAPAGSAPSVAGTGTTNIPFETVNFTLANNTAPGVYHFAVTGGGIQDAQGSWADNTANATFDINSTPTFTITVVPEPATWSLFGLGGLGTFGLTLFRARRRNA